MMKRIEDGILVDLTAAEEAEIAARVAAGVAADATQTAADAVVRTDNQAALAAITNLQAYMELTTPTNAQTVAVVRLLCRVAIVMIRRVVK